MLDMYVIFKNSFKSKLIPEEIFTFFSSYIKTKGSENQMEIEPSGYTLSTFILMFLDLIVES